MTNKIILFLVPFLFAGCGNAENKPDLSNTAPEKDPLKEAVDWAKLQNRNGDAYLPNTDVPYSGWAKRTFGNEQVEVLAYFTDGTVTDLKLWQENGIIRFEGKFVQGEVSPTFEFNDLYDYDLTKNSFLLGQIRLWHSNGEKKAEYIIKDGAPSGKAITWHENGQIHLSGTFKEGKLEGSCCIWYENGQKMHEGNYSNNNKVGLWTTWYENGQKEKEGNYTMGNEDGPWTVWYENGQKKVEATPINGQKNGILTSWFENGQMAILQTFKNDKLNGRFTEWYENGQEVQEGNYSNDKKAGVWTTWDENGQKKEEGNFIEGKMDGPWIFCDENRVESKRHYKNGELVSEPLGLAIEMHEVKQVTLNFYEVNLSEGMINRSHDAFVINLLNSKWSLEKSSGYQLKRNEMLNQPVLNEMVNTLVNMKTILSEKKPEILSRNLQQGREFLSNLRDSNNQEIVQSLQEKGFYTFADKDEVGQTVPKVLAAYGELILEMNSGIEYVIRFGDLHKGENEGKGLHDGRRYFYVFARVNNISLGSDANGIKAAKFAKELNEKLSEWFYVISKDDLEKIRLDRSSFVIPNPDFSIVDEVAASHILISYKDADRAGSKISRTKIEAKKEAERIRELILNQDKDFAEMAKKYSDGPSGPKGGDLGTFKFEVMTKSFSQAAFTLELDEVSEVVETEFGFHIIKRTPLKSISSTFDSSAAKPKPPPFFTPPTALPSQVKP